MENQKDTIHGNNLWLSMTYWIICQSQLMSFCLLPKMISVISHYPNTNTFLTCGYQCVFLNKKILRMYIINRYKMGFHCGIATHAYMMEMCGCSEGIIAASWLNCGIIHACNQPDTIYSKWCRPKYICIYNVPHWQFSCLLCLFRIYTYIGEELKTTCPRKYYYPKPPIH